MRSIRLSLIFYFFLLLTGSLGAVSWFSYQTTAQSLYEREADTYRMIVIQCDARTQALRADDDRRILRQAQTLASMVLTGKEARTMIINTESLVPFGAIGAAATPHGYFSIPIWLTQASYTPWVPEGKYPLLAREIYASQPIWTYISPADDLIPTADKKNGQDYFQTFHRTGQSMQRSQTMKGRSFEFNEETRARAVLLTDSFSIDDPERAKAIELSGAFDDLELEPGVKVRRVTLKANVSRIRYAHMRPWVGTPYAPVERKFAGKGVIFPKGSTRLGEREGGAPIVYITYASDLAPIEARIREFQRDRDRQIARLGTQISEDLQELRVHMFWVVLSTLIAVLVGGFVLVRVGLKPLAKLSDAVAQVSPNNFRLPLKPEKLPVELRPIAQTLIGTLEQLHKAFEREKHAAADISHELRTPLSALMTTLEVGLRKNRSVEEYREILEDSHTSGKHMYALVERLLALARLDAGADTYRPAAVDVVDLALQCADVIRPLAKARGLSLNVHLPDPIHMHTDPNKLREVLINLMHNAVEYNKPNGSIELAVEQVEGRVRFEVRDTGIGITPDALGHVFERFYRADPSRHADTPHAGLGLAIVKSYVDLLSGSIRVASTSAGTVFTIELPGSSVRDVNTGIKPEAAAMRR